MQKWKPTAITFILVVASFFGVFTIFGTEVATGTIVGGNISIDTTWDIGGSPYVVMDDVIVDPGVTLTIDPGVRVEFDNRQFPPFLYMYVEGTLIAEGNESNMIQITKRLPAQPGLWGAIRVNSTGRMDVRFCNMTYTDSAVIVGSSSRSNITDNTIIDAWGGVQPLGTVSPGHYFANNTLIRSLLTLNSSNNTVIDNVLGWGMNIFGDRNLIARNGMPGNGGIYMEFSDDNSILSNVVTDSPDRGFWIRDSNNNVISDNVFRNIATYGIDLLLGTGNIISGNAIFGAEMCIEYYGSSGIIENNTLVDCSIDGIEARGNVNLITGNTISNCRVGLRLLQADFHKVILNEIVNSSQYGIWLVLTQNASIFHNNLIDNAVQALDENVTGRFWDADYPLGGNYWSDYNGPDIYSGPNQDILGSDGIGDDPYLINITSRDRYPLTEKATIGSPPRNVWAELTGTNWENVTITWNLSWNDGQRGNDTVAYDIYRSDIYRSNGSGYQLIGTVPNGTTSYVDIDSGHGNPTDLFYYVCSRNGTGEHACSVDQGGKFVKPVKKGWNLLSVPLIQGDWNVSRVLQTVKFDSVRFFDAFDENDHWKEYSTFKSYQSDILLNLSQGLWVNVLDQSNLTLAGRVPVTTEIVLRSGWNLIGYPALSNSTVGSILSSIRWNIAEGIDDSTSPYCLRTLDIVDIIKPGEGLWLNVSSDVTLLVHNEG
jgi:parallel beta-helix repeat protein